MIDYKNTVQVVRFANEGFKSTSINLNKNKENAKPHIIYGCYAFACQVDLFALSGKAFKRQEENVHVVYLPKDLEVYAWDFSFKEYSFMDFGITSKKTFSLGEIEKRLSFRKSQAFLDHFGYNICDDNAGYEYTEIYIPRNIIKCIEPVRKTEDLIDINGKIYIKKVILNKYNNS